MMNKLARIGLLFAGLALFGACDKKESEGKSDSPDESAEREDASSAEEPEATEEVAGEELIEKIEGCSASFAAWEKQELRDCFAEETDFSLVDGIPPAQASSPKEVIMQLGVFRNAFPDFEADLQLVLVNDRKVATLGLMSGTHKGRTLGMPPTNSEVSLYYARALKVDAEGRIAEGRDYQDQATLLHQLGVQKNMTAPSKEEPWESKVRVVAKGDETEEENVKKVEASFEAMNQGDIEQSASLYAEDAVFRYIPEKKPYEGRSAIQKGTEDYFSMNEDIQVSVRDAWAAGNWVVAETTTKATLKNDLAGAEGTKGKSWEQNSLDFFEFEDGEVTRHISFVNGLKLAADVGLIDPESFGAPPQQ